MTTMDFIALVKRMRKLQVEYRKTHSWRTLDELKDVETNVDYQIKRFEVAEMKRIEEQQPNLL